VKVIDTGNVDPALPNPEDQAERMFGIKFPNTVQEFPVLCLDRNTGEELWCPTATETSRTKAITATMTSMVSDCISGLVRPAYCYDLDGMKLWGRQLGIAVLESSLGEGHSPVVHNDKLVIVRDQQRQSFVEVLEAKTGETQ